MRNKNNTERSRKLSKNFALKIAGIMVPLLQYFPTYGIWIRTTCVPFISFITFTFQYPGMFENFITSTISWHYYGKSITILGIAFLAFSFVSQLYNHNMFKEKGPYKYFKHPQFIAICLINLGLTILCYNYSRHALIPFTLESSSTIWVVITWIVEVFLYVILAKIKNDSLKARYGDDYLDYTKSVKNRWEILTNELRIITLAIVLLLTFLLDYYIIFNLYDYPIY